MPIRRAVGLAVCAAALAAAGCGPRLPVGSDLIWTARFEEADFSEWTMSAFGGFSDANPTPPDTIVVSNQRARSGQYAALLTVDAGTDDVQQNASMTLMNLPTQAYYSAWYYLPRTVTVGVFWVIMKFRLRTSATDPTTEGELWDVDLDNLPTGEMSLRLFDHRSGADHPLDVAAPVVPVGVWFQVEAFYRNTADASGRLTLWLDGHQLVDVTGAMAPTPWVEWSAVSVAENLNPSAETLFIDDCAVSRSRVGRDGLLASP